MFYQINNVDLFVRDEGHGKPVLIFLHFWGGSSSTWSAVTDLLQNKFRCIRYDHRGWGKSGKPASGYSIRSLAADTLALIAELKLEDYIIVGHSMGGKVAQYIASQRPAGLKKLILVAPSPAFPTILPAEMLDMMRNAYTSLDGINATIDHAFEAKDLNPQTRKQVVADMQSHTENSRLGWTNIALPEDVSADISAITIPTLIIAGEHDHVDPPERLAAEVKSVIAGSEMEIIPGVGHLMMLQKPEKIAELIRNFAESK